MLERIWITGAGGLIGQYLLQAAPAYVAGARVTGLTRARLDLLDFAAVRQEFRRDQPQLVIHCAALSRSTDCQAQPALARRINVEATALLAELAAESRFVFFSSDLVFDGRTGGYDESAPVSPLSLYAETKVAAERTVLTNPRHTVIRTSLNGGISPTRDRGFNEQMRGAWRAGRTLRLFTNEFRCPIHARVTACATWELALQDLSGIFHVAGSERLSRWAIGQLVAARWPELAPKMEPASLVEYDGEPRAPDTSLNCGKAQARLSFPLPGLAHWLAANAEEVF